MNITSLISAMQSQGIISPPQKQGKGPDSQDLLGFLTSLAQQTQTTPQGAGTGPAAQLSPDDLKALTEKIAALLEGDVSLPAPLQSLTPEDLAAQIAALLQKNHAGAACMGVQPALTSDLAAALSPEIQETLPKDDISLADLATLLNEIRAWVANGGDPEKLPALLRTQDTSATTDPAALLQQLKDKFALLSTAPDEQGRENFVQFKKKLLLFLKDQGMDQPVIEHYLAALAKFLRQDKPLAPEIATAEAPAPTPTETALPAEQTEAPAPVVLPDPGIETTAPAEIPAPIVLLDPGIETTAPAETPAPVVSLDPGIETTAPAETPAPVVLLDPDIETAASSAPRETKEQSPPSRPQASAASAPPAQNPAPAPQQPVTARVAGFCVSPAMINALAAGDGGFGSDGAGAQAGGQQGTPAGAEILKPASVAALNTQNFTNYLTAARNLPSPVTQMVNINLQRALSAKIDTLTLQLEPAELGRLDIRLKFEKDGSIRAHMTVDKPETLAMLQKDSHHLEKVLQQAGLDADESSLSFDLRQQGQQHSLEGYDGGRNGGDADEFAAHMNGTPAERSLQAQIAIQANGYITQSGVNIMV